MFLPPMPCRTLCRNRHRPMPHTDAVPPMVLDAVPADPAVSGLAGERVPVPAHATPWPYRTASAVLAVAGKTYDQAHREG